MSQCSRGMSCDSGLATNLEEATPKSTNPNVIMDRAFFTRRPYKYELIGMVRFHG